MRLNAIIAAIARRLRALVGLQADEKLHPLLVGLYSFLALTAIALVFAWLTDTPLACISDAACEP